MPDSDKDKDKNVKPLTEDDIKGIIATAIKDSQIETSKQIGVLVTSLEGLSVSTKKLSDDADKSAADKKSAADDAGTDDVVPTGGADVKANTMVKQQARTIKDLEGRLKGLEDVNKQGAAEILVRDRGSHVNEAMDKVLQSEDLAFMSTEARKSAHNYFSDLVRGIGSDTEPFQINSAAVDENVKEALTGPQAFLVKRTQAAGGSGADAGDSRIKGKGPQLSDITPDMTPEMEKSVLGAIRDAGVGIMTSSLD